MADEPTTTGAVDDDNPVDDSAEHGQPEPGFELADDPTADGPEAPAADDNRAALEEENARLKAELDRHRQPPAGEPDNRPRKKRAPHWDATAEFAGRKDPVAQSAIELKRENAALRREMREREERIIKATTDKDYIRDLPPERRERVFNYYLANRHRLGDPAAADAELLAKELKVENEKLKRELAKHQRAPNPNVARTDVRDVPAHEAKGKAKPMTMAQFDAYVESAATPNQRMERQGELEDGAIVLTDA